jgi:NitT/TauT family transport system substrate-binding protein/putative hydroxymethylpyrimidine transport system substrate-binding protein
MRRSRPIRFATLIAAAVLLAGCGEEETEATEATLVLDFVPNAVHTGIYCALDRGYYEANDLELEIVEPTSTSDTLKLIDQGRAAFGLADAIDVGQQIDRGLGAKAVMAVVQQPLGGVITLEEAGIRSPRDLGGRTVGVTGVPSDDAVLDAVVEGDDGNPEAVDTVTIGFNTVPALHSGRVDAITGYPAADGTALEQRGEEVRAFPLGEWGGPGYPGLVAFSTADAIESDPELMRAFVDATVRGYEDTLDNPDRCLEALVDQVPETDRKLAEAQLDAYLPLFQAPDGRFGALRPEAFAELSRFLREGGLAGEEIPPQRFATDEFVPGGG